MLLIKLQEYVSLHVPKPLLISFLHQDRSWALSIPWLPALVAPDTMDGFSWGDSRNVLISFLWDGQINAKGAKGLSLLSNSWSAPFALSCICLFLQIIHILLHSINTFRKPVIETEPSLTDSTTSTFSHSLKKKIKSFGGWTIYLFMVARLFGCLVLFTLSVNSLLRCLKNHSIVDTHLFVGCPEGLTTLTFVNSFLLSLL